jgi:exodeoxyribonuclease VII large subunit
LIEIQRQKMGRHADRLSVATLERDVGRYKEKTDDLGRRLADVGSRQVKALRDRLEATDRMRQTLGYQATLERGYAVVRGDGALVKTAAQAGKAAAIEIEFADGRLAVGAGAAVTGTAAPAQPAATKSKPQKAKPKKADSPDQGSLF